MAWGTLPPSDLIIAHPIGVCQGVSSVPPILTRCSRAKLKYYFRFGLDLSSKEVFFGVVGRSVGMQNWRPTTHLAKLRFCNKIVPPNGVWEKNYRRG